MEIEIEKDNKHFEQPESEGSGLFEKKDISPQIELNKVVIFYDFHIFKLN